MKNRKCSLVLVVIGLTALTYAITYTQVHHALVNSADTELTKSHFEGGFEVHTKRDGSIATPLDSGHVNVAGSVVYVWCSGNHPDRQFEFRHYLSVSSAIRHLDADNVYFYYDREPEVDKKKYNTWLSEIFEQFPFLHKRKMTSTGCNNSSAVPEKRFVEQVLSEVGGGIYVHEDVILTSSAIAVTRSAHFIAFVDEQNNLLLLSSDNNESKNITSGISGGVNVTTFLGVTLSRIQQLSPAQIVNITKGNASIITTSPSSTQILNQTAGSLFVVADRCIQPDELWELEGELGRRLRTVAYGKPDVARPQPSFDELIPNIAHVVWIGGGKMDFLFYLTVLSLLNVAMVDTVYIHGDAPPHGYYWDLVENDPRVKVRIIVVSFIIDQVN